MRLVLSFFILLLGTLAFAQDLPNPQPEQPIPMNLIAVIAGVVLAINAFLFGLYQALGYLKDKTAWGGDNAAYDFLAKVLGFLQKIIEVIGPVTAVKKSEPPK